MKSTLLALALFVTGISAQAAPQDHIQGPYEGMKISEANLSVGLAVKLKEIALKRSTQPLDTTYVVFIESVAAKPIQTFLTSVVPLVEEANIYEMKVRVDARAAGSPAKHHVRLDCEMALYTTTREDNNFQQTAYPPVRLYCEDKSNKRTLPAITFDVSETEDLIGLSKFEFFGR